MAGRQGASWEVLAGGVTATLHGGHYNFTDSGTVEGSDFTIAVSC